MASIVRPSAKSVSSMLGMLFGVDDLAVAEGQPSIPADVVGASYIDDDGGLVALLVADYPFAAFSGAALSMIPKAGAEDMVEEKALSDGVKANFYEVANICSRLLMNDQSTHIRVSEFLESSAVSAGVESLAGASIVAFEAPIPRYGSGKLFFVVS